MKILLDARMVGPKVHGIGRYTVDLIHGLYDKGCDISIIYQEPEAPPVFRPGAISHVFHLPVPFASPRESWSLALSNIRWDLHKFDIIHFPSFAVPMPWGPLPWGKVVITIHDTIHLMENQSFKHKLYYNFVVNGALHKARSILTVSEWSRNQVVKNFNIPERNVHVVRNGLEKNWFSSMEDVGNISDRPPVFACLGNIKEHKNVRTLIEASRELWQEGRGFRLELSLSGGDIPDEWGITQSEREKINVFKM